MVVPNEQLEGAYQYTYGIKKKKNLRVFGKSESKNDFFECAKEVETDGGVCVNIQER